MTGRRHGVFEMSALTVRNEQSVIGRDTILLVQALTGERAFLCFL